MNKVTINNKFTSTGLFLIAISALFLLMPEFAAAATDPLGDAMCKIFALVTGSIAKTVGVIGIAALGIGLFLGKLNWGVAVAVGIGVILIFGAPQVIGWLTGGDAANVKCDGSGNNIPIN